MTHSKNTCIYNKVRCDSHLVRILSSRLSLCSNVTPVHSKYQVSVLNDEISNQILPGSVLAGKIQTIYITRCAINATLNISVVPSSGVIGSLDKNVMIEIF